VPISGSIRTFNPYEYETVIAAGVDYVPPVGAFFTFFGAVIAGNDLNIDWFNHDTSAWVRAWFAPAELNPLIQSAAQPYQISNADLANTQVFGCYGWIVS